MARHPPREECWKFPANFDSRQKEKIEDTRSFEEVCVSWGEKAMARVGNGVIGGWRLEKKDCPPNPHPCWELHLSLSFLALELLPASSCVVPHPPNKPGLLCPV